MTLPLKKAVDSLFNRCGTIGNYQGREVLFLLIEPDEVVGVGFVKAHTDIQVEVTHFAFCRIPSNKVVFISIQKAIRIQLAPVLVVRRIIFYFNAVARNNCVPELF